PREFTPNSHRAGGAYLPCSGWERVYPRRYSHRDSVVEVRPGALENSIASTSFIVDPSPRPISTGRLNTLPCVHLRPINVVIYHGPYLVNPVGNLILERASHLDAFSAYPFRRSLTSRALGRTTGTRELRPSRSSRTRDSLAQISYGCDG